MIKNWKWLAGGGALLVLLGVGAAMRCRKPAPPPVAVEAKTETVKVEDKKVDVVEQKEIKKDVRRVRERYRPDGTVAERTTTEAATDTHAQVKTITVEKVVEKVKTETIITPVPVVPKLGLQIAPEWDSLRLKPQFVHGQIDFSIGSVFGARLRAGPTARWDTNSIKPEAYGIVLRAEIP